jgi:hypothetical protein
VTDNVRAVVDEAERWLGFRPAGNMSTPFGELSGYNGQTWAGMFVDYVFFKAGVVIPSCGYSPTGLAEFVRQRRLYKKPRPGDVVFFSFPVTGENYGMPHVGLVKATDRWNADGLIKTIEGNISSGLPKGDPGLAGVFERVRSRHEVLGFGRPAFRPAILRRTGLAGKGTVDGETVRPGRRNRSIGLVQAGLVKTVGLGKVTVDMFDGETERAYAHWQRMLGYVGPDARGIPDLRSLRALGERTGLFTVEETK